MTDQPLTRYEVSYNRDMSLADCGMKSLEDAKRKAEDRCLYDDYNLITIFEGRSGINNADKIVAQRKPKRRDKYTISQEWGDWYYDGFILQEERDDWDPD